MYKYQEFIEKLLMCSSVCKYCADACLKEKEIEKLVQCIRLDYDCAKICEIAGDYLVRDSAFTHEIIKLCGKICGACAEECEKHEHEHCRECGKICRECEEACKQHLQII